MRLRLQRASGVRVGAAAQHLSDSGSLQCTTHSCRKLEQQPPLDSQSHQHQLQYQQRLQADHSQLQHQQQIQQLRSGEQQIQQYRACSIELACASPEASSAASASQTRIKKHQGSSSSTRRSNTLKRLCISTMVYFVTVSNSGVRSITIYCERSPQGGSKGRCGADEIRGRCHALMMVCNRMRGSQIYPVRYAEWDTTTLCVLGLDCLWSFDPCERKIEIHDDSRGKRGACVDYETSVVTLSTRYRSPSDQASAWGAGSGVLLMY